MTTPDEHTFRPGDRAYHVVRREVVELRECRRYLGTYPLQDDLERTYTAMGYAVLGDPYPHLLPLWHPDVPERCREKRKRKVEVVAWANVFTPDTMELYWTKSEAKESAYRGEPMVATAVELRGSYEVDE